MDALPENVGAAVIRLRYLSSRSKARHSHTCEWPSLIERLPSYWSLQTDSETEPVTRTQTKPKPWWAMRVCLEIWKDLRICLEIWRFVYAFVPCLPSI